MSRVGSGSQFNAAQYQQQLNAQAQKAGGVSPATAKVGANIPQGAGSSQKNVLRITPESLKSGAGGLGKNFEALLTPQDMKNLYEKGYMDVQHEMTTMESNEGLITLTCKLAAALVGPSRSVGAITLDPLFLEMIKDPNAKAGFGYTRLQNETLKALPYPAADPEIQEARATPREAPVPPFVPPKEIDVSHSPDPVVEEEPVGAVYAYETHKEAPVQTENTVPGEIKPLVMPDPEPEPVPIKPENTFVLENQNWSQVKVDGSDRQNITLSTGLSAMIGGDPGGETINYAITSMYLDGGSFDGTVDNGTRNGREMSNTISEMSSRDLGQYMLKERIDGDYREFNDNYGFMTLGTMAKIPVSGDPHLSSDYQGLTGNPPPSDATAADVFMLKTEQTMIGTGGETADLRDRFNSLMQAEGKAPLSETQFENVSMMDFYALQYNASIDAYPNTGATPVSINLGDDGKVTGLDKGEKIAVTNFRVVAETNFGRREGEALAFGNQRINDHILAKNPEATHDQLLTVDDGADVHVSVEQLTDKLEDLGLGFKDEATGSDRRVDYDAALTDASGRTVSMVPGQVSQSVAKTFALDSNGSPQINIDNTGNATIALKDGGSMPMGELLRNQNSTKSVYSMTRIFNAMTPDQKQEFKGVMQDMLRSPAVVGTEDTASMFAAANESNNPVWNHYETAKLNSGETIADYLTDRLAEPQNFAGISQQEWTEVLGLVDQTNDVEVEQAKGGQFVVVNEKPPTGGLGDLISGATVAASDSVSQVSQPPNERFAAQITQVTGNIQVLTTPGLENHEQLSADVLGQINTLRESGVDLSKVTLADGTTPLLKDTSSYQQGMAVTADNLNLPARVPGEMTTSGSAYNSGFEKVLDTTRAGATMEAVLQSKPLASDTQRIGNFFLDLDSFVSASRELNNKEKPPTSERTEVLKGQIDSRREDLLGQIKRNKIPITPEQLDKSASNWTSYNNTLDKAAVVISDGAYTDFESTRPVVQLAGDMRSLAYVTGLNSSEAAPHIGELSQNRAETIFNTQGDGTEVNPTTGNTKKFDTTWNTLATRKLDEPGFEAYLDQVEIPEGKTAGDMSLLDVYKAQTASTPLSAEMTPRYVELYNETFKLSGENALTVDTMEEAGTQPTLQDMYALRTAHIKPELGITAGPSGSITLPENASTRGGAIDQINNVRLTLEGNTPGVTTNFLDPKAVAVYNERVQTTLGPSEKFPKGVSIGISDNGGNKKVDLTSPEANQQTIAQMQLNTTDDLDASDTALYNKANPNHQISKVGYGFRSTGTGGTTGNVSSGNATAYVQAVVKNANDNLDHLGTLLGDSRARIAPGTADRFLNEAKIDLAKLEAAGQKDSPEYAAINEKLDAVLGNAETRAEIAALKNEPDKYNAFIADPNTPPIYRRERLEAEAQFAATGIIASIDGIDGTTPVSSRPPEMTSEEFIGQMEEGLKEFSNFLTADLASGGKIDQGERNALRTQIAGYEQSMTSFLESKGVEGMTDDFAAASVTKQELVDSGMSGPEAARAISVLDRMKDIHATMNITSSLTTAGPNKQPVSLYHSLQKLNDRLKDISPEKPATDMSNLDSLEVVKTAVKGEMATMATENPDHFDNLIASGYGLPEPIRDESGHMIPVDQLDVGTREHKVNSAYQAIRDLASSGNLPMPANMGVVDRSLLGGANGAYLKNATAPDNLAKPVGPTILIASDLIGKPEEMKAVYMEEMFHHLESHVQDLAVVDAEDRLTDLGQDPEKKPDNFDVLPITDPIRQAWTDLDAAKDGHWDAKGDEGRAALHVFQSTQNATGNPHQVLESLRDLAGLGRDEAAQVNSSNIKMGVSPENPERNLDQGTLVGDLKVGDQTIARGGSQIEFSSGEVATNTDLPSFDTEAGVDMGPIQSRNPNESLEGPERVFHDRGDGSLGASSWDSNFEATDTSAETHEATYDTDKGFLGNMGNFLLQGGPDGLIQIGSAIMKHAEEMRAKILELFEQVSNNLAGASQLMKSAGMGSEIHDELANVGRNRDYRAGQNSLANQGGDGHYSLDPDYAFAQQQNQNAKANYERGMPGLNGVQNRRPPQQEQPPQQQQQEVQQA